MRMMRRTPIRVLAVVLAVGLLSASVACAARGARNQARVAALTVGEAALALDQVERDLYAAGIPGYDKLLHDQVGQGVLKVLYAARAFERAARQWQDGLEAPAAVDAARVGVTVALDDIEHLLPAAAAIRDPLLRALAGIRAVLASPQAMLPPGPVRLAQLPSGGLLGFLALMQVFAALVSEGRTTFARLVSVAKQEGATDEELDALDLRLTSAIDARAAEDAQDPTS